MTRGLLALLALAALPACSYYRGQLTLASAHGLPQHYRIVNPRVQGEGCIGAFGAGPSLERAVRQALEQEPDADVLVSVEVSFEGSCYRVEGAALEVLSEPAAP